MKIARLGISEIMEATGGVCYPSRIPEEAGTERIVTDSRSTEQGSDRMFVALITRKNDGHKYMRQMYDTGVRYFLVSRLPLSYQTWDGAFFIQVPDTLTALQAIARYHREKFTVPVVGITGSNGKTVVKEWLSFLLGFDKHVVRSPQSYNSQTGVPLSVLQMQPGHDVAVFEAGISQQGEMAALASVIRPTIGIFTNIGSAHDAGFPDRQCKIAEKLKLFGTVERFVYCADYENITAGIKADVSLRAVKRHTWTFFPEKEADLRVLRIRNDHEGATVIAMYREQELKVEIPFSDKASIENAVHCWLFMLVSGYTQEVIASRIRHLPVVKMRMEMREGVGNSFVINDVYNSDFHSFCLAVDFLGQHGRNQPRCVILSDVPESGKSEDELYEDVSDILRRQNIDEFVGIGSALIRQKKRFHGIDARFYPDTDRFLEEFVSEHYFGKAILLKGARVFQFERIGTFLERKVHETVMEVNLTAMVHNLNFFRGLIRPETKLMVMGKAFSYGSGSHEIADTLAFNHVDYVTVAYPDEAILLRNNGIRLPIMCMNAEEDGLETVLRYQVEPVIYNFRIWKTLQLYLDRRGLKEAGCVRIHIGLDTGMHRMGFEESDVEELILLLKKDPRCHVQSVFTHLATADMPEMDVHTRRQLDTYTRLSERILACFPYKILRHCLNTAGIFRFPEYQFDMVRLGIGLYGVGTDARMQSCLETVSTLKTVISQVRTIPAGDAVGYGRCFIAPRETKVGVIGIGYADGLDRHLGNGRGRVWVRGKLVPIIGNICMDMCMIDLTDTDAREKDEVVIFGKQNPITTVAETLGTIPYEVLTGVSQRVKRIYIQE